MIAIYFLVSVLVGATVYGSLWRMAEGEGIPWGVQDKVFIGCASAMLSAVLFFALFAHHMPIRL